MVDTMHFHTRLEQEQKRLQEELFQLTRGDEEVQGTDPLLDSGGMTSDPADDADAMFQMEKSKALQANIRNMLLQIEEALDRIKQGSYGLCANCGKPINENRLEALPYVTLCIDCQSAMERKF